MRNFRIRRVVYPDLIACAGNLRGRRPKGEIAVSPFGNPQEFGLDVRGFTGGGFTSYFVVLVDGIQVNDVDSGLVDWNLLPLDRQPQMRLKLH